MASYLQRYQAGEHVQVWDDLRALGPISRGTPEYDEALQVGRETMRRVRLNLAILVERLRAQGYVFGYETRSPEFVSRLSAGELEQIPPFLREATRRPEVLAEPPADIHMQLESLNAQIGPLPLSLYAWYETIGEVNFAGSYPVADPLDPEGFNDLYQYRMAHALTGLRGGYQRPRVDLEPLWAKALSFYVTQLPFRVATKVPGIHWFAPSEAERQGFASGVWETHFDLPNLAADGILWGARPEEPFVAYLRRAVRWGGFPGLERRTRQPLHELAILTEDLVPF